VHLIAVICFSIVHTSTMWASRAVLFPLLGLGPYDYGDMHVRYFMEFPSQVIAYSMWVAAYTIYKSWLRTKDLGTQLVSARLENLSHQLQPHFLFNALNAVSATMYEDLGRADRMLERICDFLRATLRLPDSPMVPIATELALARQYLEVMKARLEDRLQFEIHCDPAVNGLLVPALLLQPLVENAVEHGQDPASGFLNIAIDVRRVDGKPGDFIEIAIRDHGPGLSNNGAGDLASRSRHPLPSRDRLASDSGANARERTKGAVAKSPTGLLTHEPKSSNASSGHGLVNARRRLHTVYGDRATLSLSEHPEGGAVVEIQIPA
jgi:sensor histidine kinase YesM